MKVILAMVIILCALAGAAHAVGNMQITEWMYQGAALASTSDSEFAEFTNMGSTALDLTGWSFSDNHEIPGNISLSDFGVVKSGESVILTAASASDFRTAWGLAATVKVIGGNTQNLGRSDEINLYDPTGALVDRLTYNDQASPAQGPRTQNKSCTIPVADLALQTASSSWSLASTTDGYGSKKATDNDIANPGYYYGAPVTPEPGSMLALATGLIGLVGLVRRKK